MECVYASRPGLGRTSVLPASVDSDLAGGTSAEVCPLPEQRW